MKIITHGTTADDGKAEAGGWFARLRFRWRFGGRHKIVDVLWREPIEVFESIGGLRGTTTSRMTERVLVANCSCGNEMYMRKVYTQEFFQPLQMRYMIVNPGCCEAAQWWFDRHALVPESVAV